jgi:hypothetical protein
MPIFVFVSCKSFVNRLSLSAQQSAVERSDLRVRQASAPYGS